MRIAVVNLKGGVGKTTTAVYRPPVSPRMAGACSSMPTLKAAR